MAQLSARKMTPPSLPQLRWLALPAWGFSAVRRGSSLANHSSPRMTGDRQPHNTHAKRFAKRGKERSVVWYTRDTAGRHEPTSKHAAASLTCRKWMRAATRAAGRTRLGRRWPGATASPPSPQAARPRAPATAGSGRGGWGPARRRAQARGKGGGEEGKARTTASCAHLPAAARANSAPAADWATSWLPACVRMAATSVSGAPIDAARIAPSLLPRTRPQSAHAPVACTAVTSGCACEERRREMRIRIRIRIVARIKKREKPPAGAAPAAR